MDNPELAPAPSDPTPGAYRNLWVPLIVVPFLVVGVIALVFVFFGAIRGEDPSMEQNLATVTSGGANERKQAALSLAAQALENSVARSEGRDAPWPAPDALAIEPEVTRTSLRPLRLALR